MFLYGQRKFIEILEATVVVVVAVVVVVDDVIFLALNIVVVNVVAMPLHVFTHADNIQLW